MKTAACLVAMIVAASAAAQVREQVTVEVIEVPVYVIGNNGQPVRGLTKSSFELRVNGRRQPIEYFDAIDFATPDRVQAPSPVRRDRRERRLYLLLFDAAYSLPGFLARAQNAAHYAVDHANAASDLFAVATYTANDGVQFATPFTADRALTHRAIQTLSIRDARDPLALAMSPGDRTDWSTGAKYDSELKEQLEGGAANQDMQKQVGTYRVEDLLGNLGDLAKRLGGLEGQKHVLFLSTGFSAAALHGGASPTPAATGGGGLDARALHTLDGMFRSFRTAGVFLDTVDIAGQRSKFDNTTRMTKAGEIEMHTQMQQALEVNDSLRIIADGTGGVFVHDRNDLGNAIAGVETSQQVVYLLGFNRGGAKGGDISVHVKGAPLGTRVSYRQGFGAARKRADVDPLQLADILLNDVPQSGLTLPIRFVDGDVEVMLPVDQVRPQLVTGKPFVDVMLYVFDAKGAAVEGMQKRVKIDEAVKQNIVLRKKLAFPPGRYVAKAIARIEGTSSLGFAKLAITKD